MPVLSNPRHEAFAQAIFSGIVGAKGGAHSQAEAYRRAGYHVINGNSARACASRLLTFANGIAERVRELQEEAAERAQESADKCVQELNQLRRDAHSDKAYGAAVAAVMGKVKILNLIVDQPPNTSVDFSSANSMQDIGRKLLQSIGFSAPDDASIQAAIEANDAFIAKLEAIRDSAQGLTIDQTSVEGCQPRSASMKKRRRRL
jgi:Terminase small subunit